MSKVCSLVLLVKMSKTFHRISSVAKSLVAVIVMFQSYEKIYTRFCDYL